jgi:hypothetical protein
MLCSRCRGSRALSRRCVRSVGLQSARRREHISCQWQQRKAYMPTSSCKLGLVRCELNRSHLDDDLEACLPISVYKSLCRTVLNALRGGFWYYRGMEASRVEFLALFLLFPLCIDLDLCFRSRYCPEVGIFIAVANEPMSLLDYTILTPYSPAWF